MAASSRRAARPGRVLSCLHSAAQTPITVRAQGTGLRGPRTLAGPAVRRNDRRTPRTGHVEVRTMTESFELSRAECESLLRAGVAGRVAFVAPDGPHILPINYVGRRRRDRRPDLAVQPARHPRPGRDAGLRDRPVRLRVPPRLERRRPRSRGGACRTRRELEHIHGMWAPHPWASGVRPLFIRIPWKELTGRRLGGGWDPLAAAAGASRRLISQTPPGPRPSRGP